MNGLIQPGLETRNSKKKMRKFQFTFMWLAFLPAAICQANDSLMDSVQKRAAPLLSALNMIGTPYKYGSSNPEKGGVDCSGLVRHVYKESEGINLPHNAREISEKGEQVAKDELKPGDLVFFNTLKKPFSHVGIYAGDGKFVHSSSSRTRKVQLSDINQSYWAQRFNGARRITGPSSPQ